MAIGTKNQLEIYLLHRYRQILAKEREKEKVVQDSVQTELDDTIYELSDPPKLELGDRLLNSLGVEAHDILEQKFVNKTQQEDAVLEQIKEDYNFDGIKGAFDEGAVPHQLDFFYGGQNIIAFLLSDQGQNLMTNNSIHIESGEIFYQNFNTGKNFYNFVLALQDDQTAPVPKRISYHRSFEMYIQNLKNLIYMPIKMQNIYFIDLTTILKRLVEKDKPSSIP